MASLIGCGFPWHNLWMFFLFGMEVFCSTRTITGVQNFNKVDFCPQNKTEWQKASTRLNCTNIANNPKNRYHCLPIYDLSTLMEFCYNERRPRIVKELCMAYVQRSNAFKSYNCSTFNEGCPDSNYFSDESYKFPRCTNINPISRCYAAESSCGPTPAKKRKNDGSLVIAIVMLVLSLLVTGLVGRILYKKRKKKTVIDLAENEKKKVDEEKLIEFMSKTEIKISHIRCIIVGCADAGKTTFLKRLETTEFKEVKEIEETTMADIHVNIFEVPEDGDTIKSVEKIAPTISFSSNMVKYKENEIPKDQMSTNTDDEFETNDEGVELLYSNTPYKETTPPEEQISTNTELRPSVKVEDTDKKDIELESIKVETSPSLPQSTDRILSISNEIHQNVETNHSHNGNEKYAMAKIMDAIEQMDKNPGPRITVIDFAGQSQYYAFHQIYLSPKTIYILIVDMTKSPNAIVPDTDGESGSRFKSWTYRDYYRFWLNSIDSFSDPKAQVIVVGTHEDQISTEKKTKFRKEFFDIFHSDTHLQRHLHEERYFNIGFPKSGLQLEDLGEIKKRIAYLVHDQESIRPVWAIYEHIFEKEKEQKIISRKSLLMWNESLKNDLRMNDADISKMLLFFHRVGILLYFDEDNLKETIILDIQWFSNAFKCIIAFHVDQKNCSVDRIRFRNTGELDDKKLEELWKSKENEGYIKHKEKILPYMEQLGLLAICNTECITESPVTKEIRTWYYIPSMNNRPYEIKINENEFSKSTILCFKLVDEGQLPVYVFYKAIVKCMKIPEWSILKLRSNSHVENCIYENAACFSYRHLYVMICFCAYQIQVQVYFPKGESIDKELEIIQTSVGKKITEFTNYKFEIGYKCAKGKFNADDDNSFIPLKRFPVSQMKCEECKEVHYVENEICWVTTGESEDQDLPKDRAFVGSNAIPHSKLIAAIDFGTAYSGYAFSSRGDFENDPLRITSTVWRGQRGLFALKTPTRALFDETQTLIAFGYEAEKKFRELFDDNKHHDHYFFERFKMQLYNKSGDKKQRLTKKSVICDISGKELSAMYVFSKAIEYLHNHLLGALKERYGEDLAKENVHWVLTVPAIWDDSAKQFMRDAAEQAGVRSECLTIALEPEAASVYCKKIQLAKLSEANSDEDGFDIFSPGNQYLILDAGGGTVDITIHEVLPGGRIKELHNATGGAWGGTYLDDEFFKIFEECFGKDEFEEFKREDLAGYIDLVNDLEMQKRDISTTTPKMSLTIPPYLKNKCDISRSKFDEGLVCKGEKLQFDGWLINKLYSEVCDNIKKHVGNLLEEHKIDNILMVGGFSESLFLQETMKKAFPNKYIAVPNEAGLAVLKGAVLFGHDPSSIVSRVAKFTYGVSTLLPVVDEQSISDKKRIKVINGVRYEIDVFHKHVTKGDTLKISEVQHENSYSPVYKDQNSIRFHIYSSPREDPKYVDESDCNYLGYITVDILKITGSLGRRVLVRFIFGGTEIKVECENEKTKEVSTYTMTSSGNPEED